jgi:hypothetical protein
MDILLLVSWNRRLLAVYSLANGPKHPPDLQKPYMSAPINWYNFLSLIIKLLTPFPLELLGGFGEQDGFFSLK